jgi:hypothetical protein
MRMIMVPSCAACPYRQYHYSTHECSKMEFKELPKQESQNGQNTPIPKWCPLATFIEE